MDIREFAAQFALQMRMASEANGTELDTEIATGILEYIEFSGEVNAPQVCMFQKTRSRVTAYDYNVEAESLDLFYLIKADTLCGKVNKSKIEQGFNFVSAFYRECMEGKVLKGQDVKPGDEINEVIKLVQSSLGNIKQLRIYVITDGLTPPDYEPPYVEDEEAGLIRVFAVWDMQRIYQQDNIRNGKEKVEIDFPTNYDTDLQCLKMSDDNPRVDAYLAIIRGSTLAKIYKRYQQGLLEKNVRTFLQFKGKVNKGIRKTLREQPEMFFSFNNGISTTASEIETKKVGGILYITRLINWQIVNGGQTTAAIAASLHDSTVDLTKVFVPMKVSVIRDTEKGAELVKEISSTANSQNTVKNSDFSSNEPYLVDFERFSRSEWVPNGNTKPVRKWYFERTRGQYFDQLAQLSDYSKKSFLVEYPRTHKLTKTDIAKYDMAWKQKPMEVCRGAEKFYASFIAEINRTKPVINASYYKQMIGKAILFNTIDETVKAKKLGGYKANMNAYIMASVSLLSRSNLDFTYVWEHQKVQKEVTEAIDDLIPVVWNHLTGGNSSSYRSADVGALSKKVECWTGLKEKVEARFDKFGEKLMQKEVNDDGSYLNEAQQNCIAEAQSIEPKQWFALEKWARTHDILTPIERKAAFNYGTMPSRGKKITSLKEAQFALDIITKARELGFEGFSYKI